MHKSTSVSQQSQNGVVGHFHRTCTR